MYKDVCVFLGQDKGVGIETDAKEVPWPKMGPMERAPPCDLSPGQEARAPLFSNHIVVFPKRNGVDKSWGPFVVRKIPKSPKYAKEVFPTMLKTNERGLRCKSP
jgi:hypothetical protein